MKRQSPFSRRSFLHLSAGMLLSTGLWPGRLRAADNGRGGEFRFVVLNDTHYQSARCPEWFERVRVSIRALEPQPDFCLVVGDLAEKGTRSELGPMRDVLRSFRIPFHAVIGNHDYLSPNDRSVWEEILPGSLNYQFEHRGWRFVGLDSSEGTLWEKTRIQPATLRWLDEQVPGLDAKTPTVVFTHFPLGAETPMRPLNADDLLVRFRDKNLVAVFNGHHHGLTERAFGGATILTNRCCAISRSNHDGTTEKGYFLCTAREGKVHREFVEVKPG